MKQKMTPQQAVQFEQTSETSAQILEAAARERGCSCQPYVDWFTFDRWIAQGKVIKKRRTWHPPDVVSKTHSRG